MASDYKQNQDAVVLVKLVNSTTGAPKSGVVFSQVGAAVLKSDKSVSVLSVSSGNWTEITSGVFGSQGIYVLTIPSTLTNLPGFLGYAVSVTGADVYTGWVNLLANFTSDVITVLGTPVSTVSADIATRLATASYTAPDNSSITAIKAKTDNLPTDPASNSSIKGADSRNLTELAGTGFTSSDSLHAIKAAIGSSGGLTPEQETALYGIKAKTDNLPTNPASQTNLDVTVSSRLAASSYTAPDNSSISSIKAKTDNLPSDPASNSSIKGTDNRNLTQLAGTGFTSSDSLHEIKAKLDTGGSGGLTPTQEAALYGIKAKTDNLPSDPASNSTIQGADSRDLTQLAGTGFGIADTLHSIRVAVESSGGGLTPEQEATLNAVKNKTDALPFDPASQAVTWDEIQTRLAAADYVLPDNAGIAAIQERTDNLPDNPASHEDIDATQSAIQGSMVISLSDLAGAGFVATDSLHNIKATIPESGGLTPAQEAKIDSIKTDTTLIDGKLGTPVGVSVSADIAAVKVDTQRGLTIATGRWKLDPASKQLSLYEADGVTLLIRFNLYDESGQLNALRVFERVPV